VAGCPGLRRCVVQAMTVLSGCVGR